MGEDLLISASPLAPTCARFAGFDGDKPETCQPLRLADGNLVVRNYFSFSVQSQSMIFSLYRPDSSKFLTSLSTQWVR